MTSGVIPIVSPIKPLLEIIQDNYTGIVLSMVLKNDIIKLVELIKNQPKMLRFSVNAKKTTANYSSVIFSQNLAKIYG